MVYSNMGIIYKICKLYADGEDQEDLKQEIIYQLWRFYLTYRGDSKFQTWMYRVALNTAMLGLRARKMKYTRLSDQELRTSEDPFEKQDEETRVKLLYKQISKLKVMKKDELIHMWQEGNDRMFKDELTDKDMITKYLSEKTLKGNRNINFNLVLASISAIILISNLNLYIDNDNGSYVINNKAMFVGITLLVFLFIYGTQKAKSLLGLRKLKAYLSDLQQGALDQSEGIERSKNVTCGSGWLFVSYLRHP